MSTIAVLNFIQIILFILDILLAWIYIIPILVVRRFHKINNVFTVNLCFAIILCCCYWLLFYIIFGFSPQILNDSQACVALNYFEMMCNLQVPLALVEVSVYRLCSIVYHTKPFFKKNRWVMICISCQWMCGILLSFPRISSNDLLCGSQEWRRVYTSLVIVAIPLLICVIINMIIFNYVRSSTNRIQPESPTIQKTPQSCLNRRDLHLIRHMIVMLAIFSGGWSPIYIYAAIFTDLDFGSVTISMLILLAEISVLFDLIDLFLYNHELRQYLKEKIFIRH